MLKFIYNKLLTSYLTTQYKGPKFKYTIGKDWGPVGVDLNLIG